MQRRSETNDRGRDDPVSLAQIAYEKTASSITLSGNQRTKSSRVKKGRGDNDGGTIS